MNLTPQQLRPGMAETRPEETLPRLERELGLTIPELNMALHLIPDDRWRVYGQIPHIRESLEVNRRRLDELASLPSAEEIDRLANLAAEALQVSTIEIVEREVQLLIGAYPKAALTDAEVYISALVFDILDTGVSDAVLVEACRTVRRTLKFVPSISEVLAVANAITDKWRSLAHLAHKRRVVQRAHEAAVAGAEEMLATELSRIEAAKADEAARKARAKPVEPAAAKEWFCPYPSLQNAWRGNTELEALLRRANSDLLCQCSSLLATKGAEAAEAWLRRKSAAGRDAA